MPAGGAPDRRAAADSPQFVPTLEGIRVPRRGPGRPRTPTDRVIADKGYSSRANPAYLRARGIPAVITRTRRPTGQPSRRGPRGGRPYGFDAERYRDRNIIER